MQRERIQAQRARFQPDVVTLIESVTRARADYREAESAKNEARMALDRLMQETLAKFQTAINSWLGLR